MDIAEYRQQSHDIWERMAAGWDEWNEVLASAARAATEQMVAALDPKRGQTILELASGAGVGGFAAAALMGGEGRLIMTDFASQMVQAERRRGAELGFDNIEYRVMDAERMDLDDDSVDGVLCRWGYMLMADRAAAVRETRRVLRDGGAVSFSVWGAPEDNQWATAVSRIRSAPCGWTAIVIRAGASFGNASRNAALAFARSATSVKYIVTSTASLRPSPSCRSRTARPSKAFLACAAISPAGSGVAAT